jgi:hypothetical protein
MKKILKRILFGKPLIMSVFEDKHGNKYGGTIHKNDGYVYVDHTHYIEEPKFLGKFEILLMIKSEQDGTTNGSKLVS